MNEWLSRQEIKQNFYEAITSLKKQMIKEQKFEKAATLRDIEIMTVDEFENRIKELFDEKRLLVKNQKYEQATIIRDKYRELVAIYDDPDYKELALRLRVLNRDRQIDNILSDDENLKYLHLEDTQEFINLMKKYGYTK